MIAHRKHHLPDAHAECAADALHPEVEARGGRILPRGISMHFEGGEVGPEHYPRVQRKVALAEHSRRNEFTNILVLELLRSRPREHLSAVHQGDFHTQGIEQLELS